MSFDETMRIYNKINKHYIILFIENLQTLYTYESDNIFIEIFIVKILPTLMVNSGIT